MNIWKLKPDNNSQFNAYLYFIAPIIIKNANLRLCRVIHFFKVPTVNAKGLIDPPKHYLLFSAHF